VTPAWTALTVAALRALYTSLGLINDPCARALLPAPLRLALRPAVARALKRPVRALSHDLSLTVPLRTLAIDKLLADAVDSGAHQVVLLGSGLDARPWRLPALSAAAVFEIDRGRSHAYKNVRLTNYKLLARSHTLIDADLADEDLSAILTRAGFRADCTTAWLCEGVLVYVPRSASNRMLDTVAALSAPGSTFIATYTTPDLGGARFTAHLRAGAWLIGEPLRGLMFPDELRAMLSARGFRISRDAAVGDWNEPRTPGPQWERLVVAVRGT